METDQMMRIIYAVGLLVLLWPAFRALGRNKRQAFDYIVLWVVFGLILALSYNLLQSYDLLPEQFR